MMQRFFLWSCLHKKSAGMVYKKDAIQRAREIAKNKGTSLKVNKRDGSVQEKFLIENRDYIGITYEY